MSKSISPIECYNIKVSFGWYSIDELIDEIVVYLSINFQWNQVIKVVNWKVVDKCTNSSCQSKIQNAVANKKVHGGIHTFVMCVECVSVSVHDRKNIQFEL